MSKDFQIPFGPWPPPTIQQAETTPDVPRRPSLAEASRIMSLNAVYYPNYRVYAGQTPAMLNYDCISHVYYAFASVSADGTVLVSDVQKPEHVSH
jgi:chitinase